MFDTLKLYFWYFKRNQFLQMRRRQAIRHLKHTQYVRETNPDRRYFGERDMVSVHEYPMANPKKVKIKGPSPISSSNEAERRILRIIPKELEKLERFRRRFIKFNRGGRIDMGNENPDLTIRSDGNITKVIETEVKPKPKIPKISFMSKRSLKRQFDIVIKVMKKHQPNLVARLERSEEQDGLTEFHHTLWYLPFYNKLYHMSDTLYCMVVDPPDDHLDLFHIKTWRIVNNEVIKKTFDLRTGNFEKLFADMMQLEPIKEFPTDVKALIESKNVK